MASEELRLKVTIALNNIYNEFLLNGNPQMAKEAQSSDFPGVKEFHNHLQKLLTSGVVYGPTKITDVWRTRTDDPTFFAFPLSTTLVTKCPPNPRIGARAIVSGFTGPYSILNNAAGWEIGLADNDNGRAGVYDDNYFVNNKEKFMVTVIDVDTSGLPPYDKKLYGKATVTIVVDRVTPSTEYRALTAAVHDLSSFIGRSTHTRPRVWYDTDTFRIYPTFADIQAGITAGTAGKARLRSRGYNGTRSGGLYTDIWYQDASTFPSIPTNDPTGLSLQDPEWINPDSPFLAYNIDTANYLDRKRTYNLYWGLSGPEIPGSPVTSSRLVSLTGGYYKTPGSEFVFQVSGYYDTPPDPSFWTLYGDYQDGYDYRNALHFGIVDPALTCGKTVAYIYIVDEASFDPAYQASISFNEFTPTASGLPGGTGPTVAGFAAMLEKLNEFSPDAYIIDVRGNGGGASKIPTALASFFGKTRMVYTQSVATASRHKEQKLIDMQTIQDKASFKNLQETIDTAKLLFNDQIAALYPDAVVRGHGKKVLVLTDTNAASNGDLFPHWFRNSEKKNPGDIGHGVKSYIIGDIDGRIFGYSYVAEGKLFTNANHNLYDNGTAVSAFDVTEECIAAAFRAGKNDYSFNNQHPVIQPDVLINFDIENTLWLDVGKLGPYPQNPCDGGTDPLILPLSTGKGQPVYEDNTTWRDRALEASLVTAIGEGCCSNGQSLNKAKAQPRTKPIHKANKASRLSKTKVLQQAKLREERQDK